MPIYAGSNLISKIATGISSALAVYAADAIRFGGGGVNPPPWSPESLFGPSDQGVWLDLDDDMDTKMAWRRNLILQSEALATSPWTNVQGVSTYVDGKIIPASTTLIHGRRQSRDNILGRVVTVSLYVKQAEAGINFEFWNVGSIGFVVNPTTGAVTSAVSCTVVVGDFDVDGYRRIASTFTETATTTNSMDIRLTRSTSRDVAFVGDGVEGLYVKNIQVESGSTATDYQKITDFNTEFLAQFPNHTLFQDSAGTTAVTGVEQPLGLVLDKSKGLVRGAELVTNGDFSNGSASWDLSAGWSVSAGALDINQVGSVIGASQTFAMALGKTYIIEFDVSNYTSGVIACGTKTGAVTSFATVSSNGRARGIGVSGTANDGIRFFSTGAGFVGTIDNITFKEISGNHATQATTGFKPKWFIDGNGAKGIRYDGVDDGMATANIDFSANAQMTVCIGLTKSSDTADGIVVELSADMAANNGTFRLMAPASASGNNFGYASKGTAQSIALSGATYSSPFTGVLYAESDTFNDIIRLQVNDDSVASSSADQGNLSYGTFPLYLGRRGGASLPFNGVQNQLVAINRFLTPEEKTQTKDFITGKTLP